MSPRLAGTFTSDTMDRHLDDKLRDAADAIFAWAVEGLKRYQDRGHLEPPEAVQVAAHEYRDRVDTVRQFLEEMCVCVADRKIATTVTDVFKAYDRWARDDVNLRDYKIGRRQDFTDALLRHGWEALRTKRGYLCVAKTSGNALAVRSAPFVDKTLVDNQLVDLSNHVYSAAVREKDQSQNYSNSKTDRGHVWVGCARLGFHRGRDEGGCLENQPRLQL